jgi:hypothetical protein
MSINSSKIKKVCGAVRAAVLLEKAKMPDKSIRLLI